MDSNLHNLVNKEPVFMAPMTGISDYPFRKILSSLASIPSYSEMVASKEIIYSNSKIEKKLFKHKVNSVFIIQIVGNDPLLMADSAKLCEQSGADVVDINMGCPSKKVTGKLSGSALMKNIKDAISIINSVVQAVNIPVTLKIRLGWDNESINAPEIAKIAEESGVRLVTVHGRTRNQFYKGSANWKLIKNVKDNVSIPIIANGDITNKFLAKNALIASCCDGIMIGRGAVGQPWILKDISFEMSNIKIPAITYLDKCNLIVEHFEEMLSHYGNEIGVRVARKHLVKYFYYLNINSSSLVNKLIRSESPSIAKKYIRSILFK